jgi:hypothetical protein
MRKQERGLDPGRPGEKEERAAGGGPDTIEQGDCIARSLQGCLAVACIGVRCQYWSATVGGEMRPELGPMRILFVNSGALRHLANFGLRTMGRRGQVEPRPRRGDHGGALL